MTYFGMLAMWFDDAGKVGAIAPSVIPAGTVTRRAVHKLWLVSSNPKVNRDCCDVWPETSILSLQERMIGSDFKSMVQCTDGWNLVGADVDSQKQERDDIPSSVVAKD